MKIRLILLASVVGLGIFPASLALAAHTPQGEASHNWAGYVAESSDYSAASGSWVVPTPTKSAAGMSDAAWVGIGGMSGSDLIQTGTRSRVEADGVVSYEAWYELFPAPAVPISMSVQAGDQMNASLKETGVNIWQITLTDLTSGAHFTTTQNYHSSQSSAEWILEAPGGSIDDFGTVAFSQAQATVGGIEESLAALGAERLSLVSASSTLLANASTLTTAGTAFSVVRD